MDLLVKIAEVDINSKLSNPGDIISYGGQIVLIGMTMVFAVLIIIWGSITCLKYLFSHINTQPKAESNSAENNVTVVQTPASAFDDEIVAVMAAAIAMAEAESSGLKFRVVSFRRK